MRYVQWVSPTFDLDVTEPKGTPSSSRRVYLPQRHLSHQWREATSFRSVFEPANRRLLELPTVTYHSRKKKKKKHATGPVTPYGPRPHPPQHTAKLPHHDNPHAHPPQHLSGLTPDHHSKLKHSENGTIAHHHFTNKAGRQRTAHYRKSDGKLIGTSEGHVDHLPASSEKHSKFHPQARHPSEHGAATATPSTPNAPTSHSEPAQHHPEPHQKTPDVAEGSSPHPSAQHLDAKPPSAPDSAYAQKHHKGNTHHYHNGKLIGSTAGEGHHFTHQETYEKIIHGRRCTIHTAINKKGKRVQIGCEWHEKVAQDHSPKSTPQRSQEGFKHENGNTHHYDHNGKRIGTTAGEDHFSNKKSETKLIRNKWYTVHYAFNESAVPPKWVEIGREEIKSDAQGQGRHRILSRKLDEHGHHVGWNVKEVTKDGNGKITHVHHEGEAKLHEIPQGTQLKVTDHTGKLIGHATFKHHHDAKGHLHTDVTHNINGKEHQETIHNRKHPDFKEDSQNDSQKLPSSKSGHWFHHSPSHSSQQSKKKEGDSQQPAKNEDDSKSSEEPAQSDSDTPPSPSEKEDRHGAQDHRNPSPSPPPSDKEQSSDEDEPQERGGHGDQVYQQKRGRETSTPTPPSSDDGYHTASDESHESDKTDGSHHHKLKKKNNRADSDATTEEDEEPSDRERHDTQQQNSSTKHRK